MPIKPYRGHDPLFLAACSAAGIRPTHRQWRKWTQRRGAARKAGQKGGAA